MVVDRYIDRLGHRGRVQPHQLAGSEGHGREAVDGCIPTMLGDIEVIHQAAIDLIRDHNRRDEVTPAGSYCFTNRKTRSDVVARVGGCGAIVEIIQIAITERRTIRKGSEISRSLARRTEDRRIALRTLRDLAAHPHGPLVKGCDAAADRVNDV